MSIEVAALTGSQLAAGLPALARLRIEVFRAWPYLYDGTLDYEADYLAKFAAAEGAVIVAARDGAEIVGCATAAPLDAVDAAFAAPFRERNIDTGHIFYCGESVLRAGYRGHGIGHRFFEAREEQARHLGLSLSTFCAVIRPADHPLRPSDYVPLDAFWHKRGYARAEGFTCRFAWKDIDQSTETEKAMQCWTRRLAP